MNKTKAKRSPIAELQAYYFYQSLFEQMKDMQERGWGIVDVNFESLRKYFHANDFYDQMINSKEYQMNTPLTLLTDFHELFVITLNETPWCRPLMGIPKHLFQLNLSSSLAESFLNIRSLEGHAKLVENIDDDPLIIDKDLQKLFDQYSTAKKSLDKITIDITLLCKKRLRRKGVKEYFKGILNRLIKPRDSRRDEAN